VSSAATNLFDAFRQFGPQGAEIASTYQALDKTVTFMTIGASYNPRHWFAMGEWARSRSDSFIGVSSSWYVSGGYRVGNFTPYLTYAQITEGIRSAPGLNISQQPVQLQPTAAALNGGLNALIATRPVQYTSSAGVRWDFRQNFDLKLQLDRVNPGAGSPGTLINIQPGFVPGNVAYILSAAVDAVF
jgi:hypothetical protein